MLRLTTRLLAASGFRWCGLPYGRPDPCSGNGSCSATETRPLVTPRTACLEGLERGRRPVAVTVTIRYGWRPTRPWAALLAHRRAALQRPASAAADSPVRGGPPPCRTINITIITDSQHGSLLDPVTRNCHFAANPLWTRPPTVPARPRDPSRWGLPVICAAASHPPPLLPYHRHHRHLHQTLPHTPLPIPRHHPRLSPSHHPAAARPSPVAHGRLKSCFVPSATSVASAACHRQRTLCSPKVAAWLHRANTVWSSSTTN